jgi:hypothetical protein
MLSKAFETRQFIHNMGWRYIFFRIGYELKKRTGILKQRFPTNPEIKKYYTLNQWREQKARFFFKSREDIAFSMPLSEQLKESYKKIFSHKFIFFSSLEYELGADYDWLTNVDSGYSYNDDKHWIGINDYSEKAGDIKFVWEPSRFSYIYTLIRYDKHSGEDCSNQIFDDILKWIDANKINQGPNFVCSQEISIRLMNWTFALFYYRDSPTLNEDVFNKIQHYIYWQTKHVYSNINFSRIAVRNNHVLTETLTLYLIGTLFPDFPGAPAWKKDGKKWFEEEIAYQVYDDGTYLQFSMNYHRVVVQLLTWAINISKANGERFDNAVYDRAKKSLMFLTSAMDATTGWLPNYGANDGALFFKLNDNHYRDYRPQLEALGHALDLQWGEGNFEDAEWYGIKTAEKKRPLSEIKEGYSAFNRGGYYIFRLPNSLSFIRCGSHHDRPSQADNLHLDIWHKGVNILHDAGSYKYNAHSADLKYFMGTRSHNSVMLDNYDQMEKGARFIWYHWTQCESVNIDQNDQYFYFEGTISAFRHVDKNIKHKRRVTISKTTPLWEVEDIIIGKPANMTLNQIWHTQYPNLIKFKSNSMNGTTIEPLFTDGYYSEFYGKKELCTELIFATNENAIKTILTLDQ